jgi:endonuclease/exonuclease/phosphatase (EEP) superfamily protein YafD
MKRACLSLLLAGCVHLHEAPVTVTAGISPDAELPATFELLCWNVHKERSRKLAAELERIGSHAHLVLLQEAIRTDALPLRSWTMVEAFRFVNGGAPAGVATGTSAATIDEQSLYSSGREPLARTPKSALATTVRLHGGLALLVINIHGVNFRDARALEAQLGDLEPIVTAHEGPVIVAGDFNTWTRRRVTVLEAFAARHGLERVFTERDAPRLDAVFQRGLTVEEATVVRSRVSDHDALRVRFIVPR